MHVGGLLSCMFYIPKIHHAFYNESKSIEINKLGRMALLLDSLYMIRTAVSTPRQKLTLKQPFIKLSLLNCLWYIYIYEIRLFVHLCCKKLQMWVLHTTAKIVCTPLQKLLIGGYLKLTKKMKNVKAGWSQGRILLWQIIKVTQGYVHHNIVQVHGHWDKHIIAPVQERNIRHQTGTKQLPELMMAKYS